MLLVEEHHLAGLVEKLAGIDEQFANVSGAAWNVIEQDYPESSSIVTGRNEEHTEFSAIEFQPL
jgi:hypothetical protein